jgi:hypothetical protein
MEGGYPTIPGELLDGWDERVREESVVFRIPAVSAIGHTVLYDDRRLREGLERAGYGDLLASEASSEDTVVDDGGGGYWRFLFASGVSFRPPLAAGIGPASLRPIVVAEARRSFQRDLQSRGFEAVDRGRNQRLRTDAGDRASLVKYTARYPFEDAPTDELRIEGWLAVWATGGEFRIAGGAYPISGLEELLAVLYSDERPAIEPNAYREELLELIRSVT